MTELSAPAPFMGAVEFSVYPTPAPLTPSATGPIILQHDRCGRKIPVYCDTRSLRDLVMLAVGHAPDCPALRSEPKVWEGDQT